MKNTLRSTLGAAAIAAVAAAIVAPSAQALPIRANSGFTTSVLGPNDDSYTGLVGLGFSANFFGTTYTDAYVNNNGNITFDSPLSTFTPFSLLSTAQVIIAPFFADVDTRVGPTLTYGTDTVGGQAAFGVNWIDVCFYNQICVNRNSFQLVLVDRSDITAGDFDIEFNYDNIDWETGQASGSDASGHGGSSARVGWSNGVATSFELPGSAVNGALLDGGPNALISNQLNSALAIDASGTQTGRYLFRVRNGEVVVDPTVPEPGILLLLSSGLLAVGAARRNRSRA